MIRRIEIKNYKAIKYMALDLAGLNVLIGPNASGKSTFLDVTAFVGDIIRDGLKAAVLKRAKSFEQLTFNHNGYDIEFAFYFQPSLDSIVNFNPENELLKYEIGFGLKNGVLAILNEGLMIINTLEYKNYISAHYVDLDIILTGDIQGLSKPLQLRFSDSISFVYPDPNQNEKFEQMGISSNRSAFDIIDFQLSTIDLQYWAKNFFESSVNTISLDSEKLLNSSSTIIENDSSNNGNNIPLLIQGLKANHPERYKNWLSHISSALPGLLDFEIVEIPYKAERFLVGVYEGDVKLPSWLMSDGTLRLLALTILAYLPEGQFNVYLIEEPENGVHPKILSYIYDSLSSVYEDQIFVATHSPLFLSLCKPEQVIIFTKNDDGSVSAQSGRNHPLLKDLPDQKDLALYFTSGILN